MSTEFDSFNSSALSAFIRSTLGARGFYKDTVIMVFCDEAQPIYNPSGLTIYNQDKKKYEDFLKAHSSLKIKAGILIPGNSATLIKPTSGILPIGWTSKQVARSPTLVQFQAEYDRIRESIKPHNIYVLVDNSGSMRTATIQPGYGQFITWLHDGAETADNVFILTAEFFEERWILHSFDFLNEVYEGVPIPGKPPKKKK